MPYSFIHQVTERKMTTDASEDDEEAVPGGGSENARQATGRDGGMDRAAP
jgi:hypothetical protein